MRLALAQLNTTVGDLRGNSARILDAYRRAVAAGAELVVTPELAITGYPPRDLLAKRRFVADNLHALEELTGHIGDTALLTGYVDFNPHRPGRDYFNAAAMIHRGRIVARRCKTLLPTYDVFDEDRYFQPADSNPIVELAGRKLAVTICEDIWNAQGYWQVRRYSHDPVAQFGPVDLILNLSASPFHLGKERTRADLLRAVAIRQGAPLVYCNLVGGNDELIFDGQSLAFDAAGNLLAQGAAFREDLVLVEIPTSAFIAQPSNFSPIEYLHGALVLGLRDYVEKCGFKSVVLGLSGGIDSAVTACLAVTALGKENVMGISLPSQFSSQGSRDDARQLAANLGIRYEVIPIQEAFQTFKAGFRDLFHGLPEDTTEENMQARIRGTTLMAISNKFGHMLLTTGNKSELAVGYCTLYGDMNGGLGVIADVPKTMVYELAGYINRTGEIIPTASITKPPSAELRPNQTDQDSLPPYEILDAILKRYVEEAKSAAEIVEETGYSEKLVRDIVRKIDLNEYKRKQAAPVLRVTTKAFGIGRRVPIAQRYVER
ncbi:MAG: Glutamine-dependent NAD(+) synthetase [Verrucomicrobiae bacterium]|nr:Glutamine-dependent NAD(+) synthetase [Verrucomicrobiae bacterium]